jgi:hypothetical protein
LLKAVKAMPATATVTEEKERYRESRESLEAAYQTIMAANEASLLDRGELKRLDDLAELSYIDASGVCRPLLVEDELESLKIRRGSLTDEEYREICSHARKTMEFLSRIPWGGAFSDLTIIAGSHHERLDGTGYPEGLSGDAIPLQAKIMAIADIYDALTAADRPYKKAVPKERALEILEMEAKAGHLDPDLLKIFATRVVGAKSGPSDP